MIVDNDKLRPTEKMLEKAAEFNDEGIGAAWREEIVSGKDKGKLEVAWEKGISIEEVKEIANTVPVPYVLHFRNASANCGGPVPEMCHPFPIDVDTSLDLIGRTQGSVLFHNGYVKDWQTEVKIGSARFRTKIPDGPWSDSRGMAWLTALYGKGFLYLIQDQKMISFYPESYDVFGTGWTKVGGIWCSNDNFMHGFRNVGGYRAAGALPPYCKLLSCRRTDNLDAKGYCPDHVHLGVNSTTVTTLPGASTGDQKKVTVASAKLTKGDIKSSGTRGSQSTTAPFQLLTVEAAQKLHQNGMISRGILKTVKKCHASMGSNGKAAKRSQKLLEEISLSTISFGLVH